MKFNVAVVIPRGGDPSVAHSVALAMEPHRGEVWDWYTLDVAGGSVAGIIDSDGTWWDVDGEPFNTDDEIADFLETVNIGEEIIRVKCHA